VTRLLRIKMAVAGVLGHECYVCLQLLSWPWERRHITDAGYPEPRLQVSHPNGRRWSIRRVNSLSRWSKYLREALAGKVQAECGPCNRKHGGALRYRRNRGSPRGGRS
jgi:hypothetical protein